MHKLFEHVYKHTHAAEQPLAVRMRPNSLDEYVGQDHVVGEGSWLRRAIERDALSSVILYGPAGTGKTTLAHVIAGSTKAHFVEVSAVSGTVKDLRSAIDAARSRLMAANQRTILFIDEIHRFSRSQQDALLHAVEERTVILIGATTENPYFEVNSALLSRSRVVELKALTDVDLACLVERACVSERGLNGRFHLQQDAKEALIRLSGGDARSALTTLELAAQMSLPDEEIRKSSSESVETDACCETHVITLDHVYEVRPRGEISYDKSGDMHYDIISAFIKSMRGSDPDAALYWLARMIDAGEDPKFIARRMLICASEDIGNADPEALLVAHAACTSAQFIGYPECRINLAQAALYLALAPKSNAAEAGIDAALADVRRDPRREVPSYLRDRHRPGSDDYGRYHYPHACPEGWVDQRYLPEGLEAGAFYHPSDRGWEAWREERRPRSRKS